jgi:hypothetical protein
MKRTEEFYLANECEFVESCLKLLDIEYKKETAVSKKTGMTVLKLEFEANAEQYAALVKMFSVR